MGLHRIPCCQVRIEGKICDQSANVPVSCSPRFHLQRWEFSQVEVFSKLKLKIAPEALWSLSLKAQVGSGNKDVLWGWRVAL
jgi:hypothetical protein